MAAPVAAKRIAATARNRLESLATSAKCCEIAALVRLQHLLGNDAVPAAHRLGWRTPRSTAAGQHIICHQKIQPSLLHRQAYPIAALNQSKRATRRRLGVMCSTMVPNAVPDMRQSLMRTMSFTPARASFCGIGR